MVEPSRLDQAVQELVDPIVASGPTAIRLQKPKAMGPALEQISPVTAQTAQVRITAAEGDRPRKDGPDA